jgi:hypothetical protein
MWFRDMLCAFLAISYPGHHPQEEMPYATNVALFMLYLNASKITSLLGLPPPA